MKIQFAEPTIPPQGTVVIGIYEDNVLTPQAAEVDTLMGGSLRRALNSQKFKGKYKESFTIPVPTGLQVSQLILLGLGKAKTTLTAYRLEELGGQIAGVIAHCQDKEVHVALDDLEDTQPSPAQAVAYIANGIILRSWRFDKYLTKEKKEDKCTVKSLTMSSDSVKISKDFFELLSKISDGVLLTRQVVSEPANVLDPEKMVEFARSLTPMGIKTEVLGEKEMKKLGMNALLGVGQGSEKDSQLVIMHWQGGRKDQAPIAIVGKGVTFDSGGISIKPAAHMDEMKTDMGGSGVVLGLMKALAGRKAKVNVIGVMGLVENMPSGSAQRPGDIVHSLSGQTIEILNTDAEGRLVLADALWYTQDRFKPQLMINLATLTGAIVVALGHEHAGLFSNNETLAEQLLAASAASGEKLWRFPLNDAYDKDIDSTIADMKNTGSGRGAGSITAAQFLQRFVNNVPWAHLDIAGVTWQTKDYPLSNKGATAFGVRLLNWFLQHYHEG